MAHTLGGFRSVSFYDSQIAKFSVKDHEGDQWDALLRYHFKVDPTGMEDDEYFKLVAQLHWVIEQENNKYKD
jgi:hypothetical protein